MKIKTIQVGSIQENTFIYYDENTLEGVIIDPGAEGKRIAETIESCNIKPLAVLLTHGHFDHIGAVEYMKERYGIKVYAHEKESALLGSGALNGSGSYRRDILEIRPDVLLKDGEELGFGSVKLKIIHTPGHTSGSSCYYNEAERILFSGDTLFLLSIGRTDFPTGDYDRIITSIKTKLLVLPDETEVFPGHGNKTNIGLEKKKNSFLK